MLTIKRLAYKNTDDEGQPSKAMVRFRKEFLSKNSREEEQEGIEVFNSSKR